MEESQQMQREDAGKEQQAQLHQQSSLERPMEISSFLRHFLLLPLVLFAEASLRRCSDCDELE
jgi:hypothetical protein